MPLRPVAAVAADGAVMPRADQSRAFDERSPTPKRHRSHGAEFKRQVDADDEYPVSWERSLALALALALA